jgi:hypothetical protein
MLEKATPVYVGLFYIISSIWVMDAKFYYDCSGASAKEGERCDCLIDFLWQWGFAKTGFGVLDLAKKVVQESKYVH